MICKTKWKIWRKSVRRVFYSSMFRYAVPTDEKDKFLVKLNSVQAEIRAIQAEIANCDFTRAVSLPDLGEELKNLRKKANRQEKQSETEPQSALNTTWKETKSGRKLQTIANDIMSIQLEVKNGNFTSASKLCTLENDELELMEKKERWEKRQARLTRLAGGGDGQGNRDTSNNREAEDDDADYASDDSGVMSDDCIADSKSQQSENRSEEYKEAACCYHPCTRDEDNPIDINNHEQHDQDCMCCSCCMQYAYERDDRGDQPLCKVCSKAIRTYSDGDYEYMCCRRCSNMHKRHIHGDRIDRTGRTMKGKHDRNCQIMLSLSCCSEKVTVNSSRFNSCQLQDQDKYLQELVQNQTTSCERHDQHRYMCEFCSDDASVMLECSNCLEMLCSTCNEEHECDENSGDQADHDADQ